MRLRKRGSQNCVVGVRVGAAMGLTLTLTLTRLLILVASPLRGQVAAPNYCQSVSRRRRCRRGRCVAAVDCILATATAAAAAAATATAATDADATATKQISAFSV